MTIKKAIEKLLGRKSARTLPPTHDVAFRAVSVRVASRACSAARSLVGRRFLESEAPMLPLRNCDSTSCSCSYKRHADRRDGPRRAGELGLPEASVPRDQRRRIKGRRRVDLGYAYDLNDSQSYFDYSQQHRSNGRQ